MRTLISVTIVVAPLLAGAAFIAFSFDETPRPPLDEFSAERLSVLLALREKKYCEEHPDMQWVGDGLGGDGVISCKANPWPGPNGYRPAKTLPAAPRPLDEGGARASPPRTGHVEEPAAQ